MKSLFLLVCFSFCLSVTFAQLRDNYITLGIQLNAMNYFGDLNPQNKPFSTELSLTNPNLGFYFAFKLNPNFHLRTSFVTGRLEGDDFLAANPNDDKAIFRYARNLHFRNDLYELSVVTVFDLLASHGRFYRRRVFTPYIFAGIAAFYHNPQARTPQSMGGNWVDLQPLHTEGQGKPGYAKPYSLIQPSIPFGGGFKFRIADRLDLSFEVGVRWTFTDYLDDVGAAYPDINDLDGDLARIMSNRSGEQVSAVYDTARDARLTQVFGPFGTNTSVDGGVYDTIPGFGIKGEIRGKDHVDLYLVSGFQIGYVLNIKRYRPFQK